MCSSRLHPLQTTLARSSFDRVAAMPLGSFFPLGQRVLAARLLKETGVTAAGGRSASRHPRDRHFA